ncbi:hypothetical protein [Aquicoccus sp. SU-CL01552]|uniref:hypothetical protein n=1 Tax=Aquicoccus sp. SU-CL01552 TaxID=3127656 RepID=UPI003105D5C3
MNLRENALAVKEEQWIDVLGVPDAYYTRFIDSQDEVIKKYLAADESLPRSTSRRRPLPTWSIPITRGW